eukprot:14412033-Alexandrium_andersonii.AAC.1
MPSERERWRRVNCDAPGAEDVLEEAGEGRPVVAGMPTRSSREARGRAGGHAPESSLWSSAVRSSEC